MIEHNVTAGSEIVGAGELQNSVTENQVRPVVELTTSLFSDRNATRRMKSTEKRREIHTHNTRTHTHTCEGLPDGSV